MIINFFFAESSSNLANTNDKQQDFRTARGVETSTSFVEGAHGNQMQEKWVRGGGWTLNSVGDTHGVGVGKGIKASWTLFHVLLNFRLVIVEASDFGMMSAVLMNL